MAKAFDWGMGLVLLGALAVAGCPAPTGRVRGRIDGGDAGCSTTNPQSGLVCGIEDEVCVATVACGAGSSRVDTCRCTFGTWSCTFGRCSTPPPDGAPPMCPAFDVRDSDPCTARQGGLTCTGQATGCDGRPARVGCFCTGSRWSCPPPSCFDGGRDARTDGDPCPSQMEVFHGDPCPSSQAGLACSGLGPGCNGGSQAVACVCTGSRWSCSEPRCPDAGDASGADVPRDNPATCPPTPSNGAMCGGGEVCRYGGACEVSCYCRAGRYECETVGCFGDAAIDASSGGG